MHSVNASSGIDVKQLAGPRLQKMRDAPVLPQNYTDMCGMGRVPFEGLLWVPDELVDDVCVAVDREIEPPVTVHAGLPDIGPFVVLFGVQ